MKSARIDVTLPAQHRNPPHRCRGTAARTSEPSSLPTSTVTRMLGALLFAVIFLTLGTYVASQDYEIVTQDGHMVTAGAVNDDVLEKLRTGKLAIRQKPGPTNALGLAKFMFQNEYPVHLHSTPSERLFARSRRGFWSWMYSNGDAR
jgi:hypothetical protein